MAEGGTRDKPVIGSAIKDLYSLFLVLLSSAHPFHYRSAPPTHIQRNAPCYLDVMRFENPK